MAGLFDPAEYLVWPGTNGEVATDRTTLKDRVCDLHRNPIYEVAVEVRVDRETGARREDVSLRCPDCFRPSPGDRKPPAKILGWVNVQTMQATEA